MKTTILTTAVLMALGFMAHAEPRASEFSDTKVEVEVKADTKDEAKSDDKAAEAKAKTDADEKAKLKAEAEAKAKVEADAKKSKATAKSEKKSDDAIKNKKIKGFIDNDGVSGDLEVGIVGGEKKLMFTPDSCKTGTCTKVVLFDEKIAEDMSDFKAIRDALGKTTKSAKDESDKNDDKLFSTAEKARLLKKKEKAVNMVTEKEVREEIASMLETECGIDEEKVNSKRGSDSRSIKNLDSALGRTRFAGLQMPEKSSDSNSGDQFRSDAECSANVLKDFMSENGTEDLTDLKDKLSDLKTAEKEWKQDLRRETNEKAREKIQKKLDLVKEEIAKVQKEMDAAKKRATAYDRATLNVAKRMIINPAVSDLATRKFFTSEDFFLHDLAATTPDSFKGVRKAASNSLLDIYKLQSQSYLAFNEMANKTTDPAQKLQFQQAALFYQTAGANYNAMMNNGTFKNELGHSASQAGLEPKSILEEIYGSYTPAAQEISNFLIRPTSTVAGRNGTVQNNQALPEILLVQNSDGTYSQATVLSGQTLGGRGERVGILANGQNRQQNNQLVRPVPLAPTGTQPGISTGTPTGRRRF